MPPPMTSDGVEASWEDSPCGLVVATMDGRIIRVNATLARWLGYEREALRGKSFDELLTVPMPREDALSGVPVDLVTADGGVLPVFLAANVAADGRGMRNIAVLEAAGRRSWERDVVAAGARAQDENQRVRVFAETLRRSLLPPLLSPPPGLDAVDYYFAASTDDIGGDFYDLFPLSRATWGFFLGDVAGKGVEAAVISGLTRYTLRAAAVYDDDPEQVLTNVNTVLSQELKGERNRFCTLIYGRITSAGKGFRVELASGGHPPPLVLRADGTAHYVDVTGGHAAGLSANPHFVSAQLDLDRGDTLMLYTDGLTEAGTGIGNERYDDEGALLRFVEAQAPSSASSIVEAIHGLLESLGPGVEDDTAVLAFGVPRDG